MTMIQKIQPEITKAVKNAYEYLGPDHVFTAKEIKEASELAKSVAGKREVVKTAEYFSPRAIIDKVEAFNHESVDKAVVGQKLDIVEGHMFG